VADYTAELTGEAKPEADVIVGAAQLHPING